MIKYLIPSRWIHYNPIEIAPYLAEAKAAVISLKTIPYQRSWVDALQKMQLKREVAGTSRIEGADFTERELDQAISMTAEQLATRSQRQARAAVETYNWIATIPNGRPINQDVILEIHRRIVTGADDDHCHPGRLRTDDQNVTFGQPRHRGADGGEECRISFNQFVEAIQKGFNEHDPLVQALAAHYHLAAMHPFLDGNGRTARALEALFLQRAGLRDTCFIAMSNYYHDEKNTYLDVLAEVRSKDQDLTSFLKFGLKGIAIQSKRLLDEIKHQVSKALFVNLAYDLFNRLKNKRTRVIGERQIKVLKILLEVESIPYADLLKRTTHLYQHLENAEMALIRDINGLIILKAVKADKQIDGSYLIKLRLEWPTQITETEFFERIKNLPKGKTHAFLQ